MGLSPMRCSSKAHSSTDASGAACCSCSSVSGSFFKGVLLSMVSLRMARTWHPQGSTQAPQVFPSALWMHLTTRLVLDPSRYFPACPQALIGRRSLQHLPELLLQVSGQDRCSSRVAMATITQSLRTSFVVAMGN